jgi:hypothetical protein
VQPEQTTEPPTSPTAPGGGTGNVQPPPPPPPVAVGPTPGQEPTVRPGRGARPRGRNPSELPANIGVFAPRPTPVAPVAPPVAVPHTGGRPNIELE